MKSKKSTPMRNRCLAIDPGFDRMGVAVMEDDSLLYSMCIETDKKSPHSERLYQIGTEIGKVIKKWKPDSLAIEALFFNKNTSSAIGVAEARGVILYEAARAGLPVYEYSPQAIKIAVTGYGKADKQQVENMSRRLVKIPEQESKRLDDELDAIAVGITHLASRKN